MEETKTHRLSKVSKQLEVGMGTITKYLNEVGFNVKTNPKTRLSNETVSILFKHFKSKIDDFIVLDPTLEIIEWIKKDFRNIEKINPEKFEKIILYLLVRKGYEVKQCGKTNEKDGGIDIIAWKKDIVTFVIAIQVKYKFNLHKKVTSGEVRDFLGAMHISNLFNAGMLITNTTFSIDSKWIEELNHTKIELKDADDIQNWLEGNFVSRKNFAKTNQITKDKIITFDK